MCSAAEVVVTVQAHRSKELLPRPPQKGLTAPLIVERHRDEDVAHQNFKQKQAKSAYTQAPPALFLIAKTKEPPQGLIAKG